MKKKILIVEDEAVIKVLKTKFESAGFTVEIAPDGKEAIKKLNQSRPDIILLDILLPKMDGFEFLENLRKNKEFGNTKVLIFSNFSDSASFRRAKELRVEDYVIKSDVSIQELVEKVKVYLK